MQCTFIVGKGKINFKTLDLNLYTASTYKILVEEFIIVKVLDVEVVAF